MTLKFSELEKVATDDGFIWYAEMKLMSENFGQVPFCLVSTDGADMDDETTLLAERIASDIDRYVKEALVFLKDELRREHCLSDDELSLLDVPVCDLPYKFEIYKPFDCEFRGAGGFFKSSAQSRLDFSFYQLLNVQNHKIFSHFWLD